MPDITMLESAAALLEEEALRLPRTLVAGLRYDGFITPWVVGAPLNRVIFETHVETQLVSALRPGDLVILDNLSGHKSEPAEKAIEACGALAAVPAALRPDLNPIEMAFAKLKAHLRAAAAKRSTDSGRPPATSASSSRPANVPATSLPQGAE